MNNDLKITYQLTQSDVYRSNTAIVMEGVRRPRVIAGLIFIEILAIVGAMGFLFAPKADGSSVSSTAASIACAFGFPLILLFVCYLNPYLAARSLYKSSANLRSPILWSFSEKLVTHQMATGTAELLWSSFIKARETREMFLLYPQKRLAFPLPKRAFANEQEIAAFRELIRGHVPDVK
jgi:hypothetical protein